MVNATSDGCVWVFVCVPSGKPLLFPNPTRPTVIQENETAAPRLKDKKRYRVKTSLQENTFAFSSQFKHNSKQQVNGDITQASNASSYAHCEAPKLERLLGGN